MANHCKTYRTWLLDEFVRRKARNSGYSVRAFARDLGIGNSSLAAVLAGRRDLSKQNALKVAHCLALSPSRTNGLLQHLGFKPNRQIESSEFLTLEDDAFNMISNWYYIGIINLAKLDGMGASPKAFAERLGISELEAANSIERLMRLGYLRIDQGSLRPATPTLSTTRNVPSNAVREYHKQNLRKAAEAITEVPVERRDVSSITFPADISRYQEATDLIMDFKRKLARLFEGVTATEVYTLAIQLFPLTKHTTIGPSSTTPCIRSEK